MHKRIFFFPLKRSITAFQSRNLIVPFSMEKRDADETHPKTLFTYRRTEEMVKYSQYMIIISGAVVSMIPGAYLRYSRIRLI